MNVKNPFALRNGQVVMIDDLSPNERGLLCNCFCPSCGDKFEAKLGDIRIHHFSHTGEGCDEIIAFLNGMYLLFKEFVDKNEMLIPQLSVFWNYSYERFTKEKFFERVSFEKNNTYQIEIKVSEKTNITFDNSEIIYKGKKPIAIVLNYQNKQMAVCLQPPPSVCKDFFLKKYKDMATLGFDTSNIDFTKVKKEYIYKMFLQEEKRWFWIYSPKALKKLDEINRKNDVWIAEENKKKQIIEQRRKEYEEYRQKEIRERRKNTGYLEIYYKRKLAAERNVEESKKSNSKVNDGKSNIKKSQGNYYEVMNSLFTEENYVKDSSGTRWIKCKYCAEIKLEGEFLRQRGSLGTCKNCKEKDTV